MNPETDVAKSRDDSPLKSFAEVKNLRAHVQLPSKPNERSVPHKTLKGKI